MLAKAQIWSGSLPILASGAPAALMQVGLRWLTPMADGHQAGPVLLVWFWHRWRGWRWPAGPLARLALGPPGFFGSPARRARWLLAAFCWLALAWLLLWLQ